MKDNELLSVIVPVYNVEKYLKKCIESLLNQTYKNLEIILVDDGSTDSSGEICDEYAAMDNRIKVIHKENGGLSSARNAGIDISTGNYIGFVDGDDYIAEDMYEYLYKNRVYEGIVACGISDVNKFSIQKGFCDIDIKSFNNIKALEAYIDLQIQVYNYRKKTKHNLTSSFCNKLFDRNLWKDIRFPVGYINEDNMIIIKLFMSANSVKSLPEAKYYYVQHLGSITQQKFNKNSFDLIKSRIVQEEQIKEYYADLLMKCKVLTLLACDNTCVKLSSITEKERKKYNDEIASIKKIIADREDAFHFLNFKSKLKLTWFNYSSRTFFFIFYIRLKIIKFYKKTFYN
ncbi:MAG: glycosyl transferase family 2 [Phascolarctobacterium sp.]|nr:MAG: glycosyl transferase family 2 [Phascolarctobacterium sp.]